MEEVRREKKPSHLEVSMISVIPRALSRCDFGHPRLRQLDHSETKKPADSLMALLRNPRNVDDIQNYVHVILFGRSFRLNLLPDLIKLAEADNWDDFKLVIDIVGKLSTIEGVKGYGLLDILDLSATKLKSAYLSAFLKILRVGFSVESHKVPTSFVKFLSHLDLSKNNLVPTSRGRRQLFPSVAQRIAKWLSHPDCQLVTLNLADNPSLGGSTELSEGKYLGNLGYGSDIYRIFLSLASNRSLQVLNVVNTASNLVDFKFFTQSATDNSVLRVVDFSRNPGLTLAGREILNKFLAMRYKRNHQAIHLELAQTGLRMPVITTGAKDSLSAFASEFHLQLSTLHLRSLGDQMFAPNGHEKKVPNKWIYYVKLISIFVFIAGGVLALASPLSELIGIITALAGLTMGAAGISHQLLELIKHVTGLSKLLGSQLDELLSVENIELVYEIIKDSYELTAKAKKKIMHLKKLRESLHSSIDALELIEKLHVHYELIAKLFLDHPNLHVRLKAQMVHYYNEVIRPLSSEDAIRFGRELSVPLRLCLLSTALTGPESLEQLITKFLLRIQLTPFEIFQTVRFIKDVNAEVELPEYRSDSALWRASVPMEVWMLDLLQRSGFVAKTATEARVQFDLSKKLPRCDGKVWTQTDYMKFGSQRADKWMLEVVNSMVLFYYRYIYQRRIQERAFARKGDLRKTLHPAFCAVYGNKTYRIRTLQPDRSQCFQALCGTHEEANRLFKRFTMLKLVQRLQPVIVELLLGENGMSFLHYLNKKSCENSASTKFFLSNDKLQSMESDLKNYHAQRLSNGLWLEYYTCKLQSYANDWGIYGDYFDYIVSYSEFNASVWPHPLVLILLGELLHIHIRFYQMDEGGHWIPHARYPEFRPGYIVKTVELLYLDDQRYTEIKEIPEDTQVREAGFKWTGDNGLISKCGMFKLSVPTLECLAQRGRLEAIELEEVVGDELSRIQALEGQVKEHEVKIKTHDATLINHEQRINAQENKLLGSSGDGFRSNEYIQLEEKLNQTHAELLTVKTELELAKEEVVRIGGEAQTKVQKLKTQVADLKERMARLEIIALNAERNPIGVGIRNNDPPQHRGGNLDGQEDVHGRHRATVADMENGEGGSPRQLN